MIFRETWQLLFDGTKTQTRRVLLPTDVLILAQPLHYGERSRGSCTVDAWLSRYANRNVQIVAIKRYDRTIYKVGAPRSIQTGRGIMAIGQFVISDLWCEWLQDISGDDAIAEGVTARDSFSGLWESVWRGTKNAWGKNPPVVRIGIGEVRRYG